MSIPGGTLVAAWLSELSQPERERAVSELEKVVAAQSQAPAVCEVLFSPAVPTEQKRKVAEKIGLSKEFAALLCWVDRRQGPQHLVDLAKRARTSLTHEGGAAEVLVTSYPELSPSDKEHLSQKLEKRLGRPVTMQTQVDESLLGGLIIEVDAERTDLSVRGRIAAMRAALSVNTN